MKDVLLTTLIGLAIPALVSLCGGALLALLGIWKKANAAAKATSFTLASAQLETGVEAAIHALQNDAQPLAAQLAAGKITPALFFNTMLTSLKKEGAAYVEPAALEALGTTMAGLEQMALGIAAKKVGLTAVATPVGMVANASPR